MATKTSKEPRIPEKSEPVITTRCADHRSQITGAGKHALSTDWSTWNGAMAATNTDFSGLKRAKKEPSNLVPEVNPTVTESWGCSSRCADHRSQITGAGKRRLSTDWSSLNMAATNTDFSGLKRAKKEPSNLVPEVNPTVTGSWGCSIDASSKSALKGRAPIVPTTRKKATDSGHQGSSQTRDPRQGSCNICAEKKRDHELIRVNKSCSHSFCTICISKQVNTRIADNQVEIPCLGLDCKHFVEFEVCIGILPKDVMNAWDRALCEALILDKFYCPFRDCSAMLMKDGEMAMKECECPHCHRLFCAQCQVPWHSGLSCKEFQLLNPDERGNEDLMVKKLAKEKKWARCPKCKFFVERTQGCPHITCRCRYEFCYGCGLQWNQSHGGCSRS